MICSKCGTEMGNEKACPNCENVVESESVPQPAQNPKKRNTPILIAIAIVILALIVTCVVLFVKSNSPEKRLQTQLDLGSRYLEELDYEQAIAAYEMALEIDPMNVEAYSGLAEAYLGTGDEDKAIDTLLTGMDRTGDDSLTDQLVDIYMDLAAPLIDAEKYDEALVILKEGYDNTGSKKIKDKIDEIESLLKAIEEERQRQEEEDRKNEILRTVGQMVVTDPQNYYWSAAPNYEEDFYARLAELDGPVFFEYEGQYIGVYPSGFIYYGEVKDGERCGHGLWYYGTEYAYSITDCSWSDDKPNGHSDYCVFRDESKMEKQPNYTYSISSSESVNVVDGIYDGEATIIWNMDSGTVHEWHVTFVDGYVQNDGDGHAGICVNCGATLGLGDYQYSIWEGEE